MPISYLAAASPVAADSLAIPVSNLAGSYNLASFDGVNSNYAFSRFLQSFLEKSLDLFPEDGSSNVLGLNMSKDLDDPTGISRSIMISVWTIQVQRLNKLTQEVTPLPIPTAGNNLGVGDFALTDLFAGAEKVANGANVTADSVVIDVSDLQPYGSPAFGTLNLTVGQDNRDVWAAIIAYAIAQVPLRTATVQSGVTAKAINAPTTPTLPTVSFDATNPTTGINQADLFGKAYVTQHTLTVSIQLMMDGSDNTIDVNFA